MKIFRFNNVMTVVTVVLLIILCWELSQDRVGNRYYVTCPQGTFEGEAIIRQRTGWYSVETGNRLTLPDDCVKELLADDK